MRTNRFAGLTTPLHTPSLHRIKTVFSTPAPSRHHRSRTTSPSSFKSTSTSPLSEPRTRSPSFEDLASEPALSSSPSSSFYDYVGSPPPSSVSARSRIGQALRIRAMGRKPSVAAVEMEEEKRSFGAEIGIMEPRPRGALVVGGIFEVLLESGA